MPQTLDDVLVVAISSRALFDFEEENEIFNSEDPHAYRKIQSQRLTLPAKPGVAFALVKKLLTFNTDGQKRVEVVILSRNDPYSGLRVFNSAAHAGIAVSRGVFTRGRSPFRYLQPLNASLLLSANEEDVRSALAHGFAAARVLTESKKQIEANSDEIRIALDGDAVLFSDEAERVYKSEGLDAFEIHETDKAEIPMQAGPFKNFLGALHRLQQLTADHPCFPMRIRTALVTARSAPAHERAIKTLASWQIEVDEAMFLGGLEKGAFLHAFEPDFFFDDQVGHCLSAASASVPAGHVISGVANILE